MKNKLTANGEAINDEGIQGKPLERFTPGYERLPDVFLPGYRRDDSSVDIATGIPGLPTNWSS